MATTPSTPSGLNIWLARLWPGRSRRAPSPGQIMTPATAKPGRSRRVPRWVAWLAVLLLAAAAAIAVALKVTPLQTVSVAGQVIKVGATTPTFSLSGPGEIDLFGQNLPTNLHFLGPVRPRLQLAQITINSELTNFVRGAHPTGAARVLGNVLADGWIRYFAWETALSGLGALLLVGAVAGWRRLPHRTTIELLAAGLIVTEAINLGAIMVTAYQAPGSLRQVHSLNQLVGSEPPVSAVTKTAPLRPGVQVVVIGDSTAAGAGLTPVRDATRSDLACGRSTDSYAQDLARANNWNVLNLACDSATIASGLLGPQGRGGQTVAAQIDEVQRARSASIVVVSVGADDLGWSAMVRYCAVAPNCNDRASAAYFLQQLASFSKNYLQLLSQLATLPDHPRVLINRYYNPFGPDVSCLGQAGFTTAKLRTLTSRLNTLNAVLAKGATDFGFASTQPDFAGHQMCSQQPFVQGLQGAAPFHPTTLGQFAIALTDQAALTVRSPLQQ